LKSKKLRCIPLPFSNEAPRQMGVKQLLAEMLQMPLLGSSIFAITSQATAKAENV